MSEPIIRITQVANLETRLTTAGSSANDAYAQANAAYARANTANGQANNAYTQANSAYLQANNAYAQANLAYSQANTANTNALNAYTQANSAYGQANDAYSAANAANTNALAAYSQANNAYAAANAAANTVRVSQNSGSTLSAKQLNFVNTANVTITVTDSGDGNANVEIFSAAGGGGGGTLSNIAISSNGVFSTNANAFNFINTATVAVTVAPGVNGNANISFTSSLVGNTAIARQSFSGNGVQTIFTLTSEPQDENHILVFVDSVFQRDIDYIITGNALQFNTAPANGADVDVYVYGNGSAGKVLMASDVYTGDGACTSYTLSQTGQTTKTFVYLDGVSQRPQYDYQVSGTSLTFNVAPANATIIEVRTLSNFDLTDLSNTCVLKTGDTMTGNLNVAATIITQNVEPNLNVTYNLGTSTKRFKDIYLSNSTIYLGAAQLTANGTKLVVSDLELTSGANLSNAVLKTGDTMTGNLTFSGNGLRILGDFSNGTLANRLAFQTTTTNGTTAVWALPNGTSNNSNFAAFSNSDPTNASTMQIRVGASSSDLVAGNTGVGSYLPMTFFSGGSERMRLDTSGNFGIGTTPSYRLHVATTAPTNNIIAYLVNSQGGSTKARIGMQDASTTYAPDFGSVGNNITFETVGVERMRIDGSGNVGIGATSPTNKLHLYGSGQTFRIEQNPGVAGNSLIYADSAGAANYAALRLSGVWMSVRTDFGNDLQIGPDETRANAKVVFNVSSGRVGIGTASPGAPLEVRTAAGTAGQFNLYSGNNSTNTKISIGQIAAIDWDIGLAASTGHFYIGGLGGSVFEAYRIQRTGTSIDSHLWSTGAGTERMRIDSSGNVNIGSTANYGGLVSINRAQASGNANFLTMRDASSGSTLDFRVFGDPTFGSAHRQDFSGAYYAFRAGTTEHMRIMSGGNVGIGVTSPSTKLHVAGTTQSTFFYALAAGANDSAEFGNTQSNLRIGGDGATMRMNASPWNLTLIAPSVIVSGALSKSSGSFKIDHPLPEKSNTHYLVHSFIEGPQADLIYRGKVTLVNGSASVNIDTAAGMTEGTFVALCRDVQCFTSNESDWDAVRGSVAGNILTIECQNSSSNAIVSWMVIGERQDKHMFDTKWTDDDGKVIVEPEKI